MKGRLAQRIERGTVERDAPTDERIQHDAEAPHVDGRTRVRGLCAAWLCSSGRAISWRAGVSDSEQLRRGAVLFAAARHEWRGSGTGTGWSARGTVGGDECCVCETGEDGLPVVSVPPTRAGRGRGVSASGVKADMDVHDLEICGGKMLCYAILFYFG